MEYTAQELESAFFALLNGYYSLKSYIDKAANTD